MFLWNEHADDPAERLDSQGQRRHVEQEHVGDAAGEDLRLHRGAQRDDLVRVQLAVRRLAEELLHSTAHERDPRRAADQDHLVDVRRGEAGVGERHPARRQGGVDQARDEPLELGARDLAVVREAVERNRERRPLVGRQADLGGLGGEPKLLHRLEITAEVGAVLGADVVEQRQDDRPVEVVAAEVRVAVRRQDLEDAVLHAQDRDVERAAAEVVDGDEPLADALQTVRERGRRRLVDDAHDVEPGDAAGVLGRLALAVVEVRGHRDDGLLDRLAEVRLGALLERLEHDRRDLRRRDLTAFDLDLHDPFGRPHLEREVARAPP